MSRERSDATWRKFEYLEELLKSTTSSPGEIDAAKRDEFEVGVLRFLDEVSSSSEESADVAADVIKKWRSGILRVGTSLRGYVKRALSNKRRDGIRAKERESAVHIESEDVGIVDVHDLGPLSDLGLTDLYRRVFERLDLRSRCAIFLKICFDDVARCAAEMGIATNAFEAILCRAKSDLERVRAAFVDEDPMPSIRVRRQRGNDS